MTTYDIFPFCDELDTLEIRLATLDPVVDVFVLVESRLTLARKAKPLHYQKNAKRYAKWADKIRHVIAELPDTDDRWKCEFAMRDAGMQALHDAQPHDWICFGDADEIPHPSHIAARKPGAVWAAPFRYYWNMMTDEWRPNTICMPFEELQRRGDMSMIRHHYRYNLQEYRNGWHFSMMGDPVEHLKTRAHAEFDTPEWHAAAKANKAQLKDPLSRGISLWPVGLQELPTYIAENLDRFGRGVFRA